MLDFLETTPAPAEPEITMHKSKIPMSKRIRAYKTGNPDADSKQIAAALNTTSLYVYQILAKPLSKARKAKPVDKPNESKLISKSQFNVLKEEVETQRLIIDLQKRQIENLQAVIGYLEGKIDDLGGLVC